MAPLYIIIKLKLFNTFFVKFLVFIQYKYNSTDHFVILCNLYMTTGHIKLRHNGWGDCSVYINHVFLKRGMFCLVVYKYIIPIYFGNYKNRQFFGTKKENDVIFFQKRHFIKVSTTANLKFAVISGVLKLVKIIFLFNCLRKLVRNLLEKIVICI